MEKYLSNHANAIADFCNGMNYHAYRFLGAHPEKTGKGKGFRFRVWAPAAKSVSVVGDFNEWNTQANPLECVGAGGIWEGFIPGLKQFDLYKYAVVGQDGKETLKQIHLLSMEKPHREQPLRSMIFLVIAGMILLG